MKKYLALAAMTFLTGAAVAQVHVGGAVGRASFRLDCSGTDSCDNSDSGYKFYGGVRLHPAWAMELGYVDFGRARATGVFNGLAVNSSLQVRAITLAAAGRLSLTPDLDVVGRLGMAHVTTKVTGVASAFGIRGTDSDSVLKPYWGVELAYTFHKQLKGTLAFDTTQGEYDGDSGTVRLVSVGAEFTF